VPIGQQFRLKTTTRCAKSTNPPNTKTVERFFSMLQHIEAKKFNDLREMGADLESVMHLYESNSLDVAAGFKKEN
jgi:hypothetical protein